jgi:hypothetical protein
MLTSEDEAIARTLAAEQAYSARDDDAGLQEAIARSLLLARDQEIGVDMRSDEKRMGFRPKNDEAIARALAAADLEGAVAENHEAAIAAAFADLDMCPPTLPPPLQAPVRPEKHECAICIHAFEPADDVLALQCMHLFHRGCVGTWLEQSETCPVCKLAVDPSQLKPPSQPKPLPAPAKEGDTPAPGKEGAAPPSASLSAVELLESTLEWVSSGFSHVVGNVTFQLPATDSSQVKSSYYSPQSKEQNPQQAEQGHAQMQQCV